MFILCVTLVSFMQHKSCNSSFSLFYYHCSSYIRLAMHDIRPTEPRRVLHYTGWQPLGLGAALALPDERGAEWMAAALWRQRGGKQMESRGVRRSRFWPHVCSQHWGDVSLPYMTSAIIVTDAFLYLLTCWLGRPTHVSPPLSSRQTSYPNCYYAKKLS